MGKIGLDHIRSLAVISTNLVFFSLSQVSLAQFEDLNSLDSLSNTRQIQLSESCENALLVIAKVPTLIMESHAEFQRIENQRLMNEGNLFCRGSLITSYVETKEAPKGSVDITVNYSSGSSQSSYGSYGSPYGGSSSGSGGGNGTFGIIIKSSVSFPLGTGSTLTCTNVYDKPLLLETALKISQSPVFLKQIEDACGTQALSYPQ